MRRFATAVLLVSMGSLGCGGDGASAPGAQDDPIIGDDAVKIVDGCTGLEFCVPACENTGPEDVCGNTQQPQQGGCWITGGGFVVDADGKDSYGGNAMSMKDGRIRGQWEHVDHGTGNKFHGQAEYLVCRHVDEPGPGHPNGPKHDFKMNQAYYGGPGRWSTPADGWQDGYWFDVMIEDHGEPGKQDEYYFTVRKMDAASQSGTVVYTTGDVVGGGNLQLHPPNNGHPYQEGMLPAWVDYAP